VGYRFVASDRIGRPCITLIALRNAHHALQRGDGDALLVLEAPSRAQHIGRVIRQMFGEGVFGLPGQRDAIDEERHAGDGVGLEQALDERGGRARLARAGGHLDQQHAPARSDLAVQDVDALDLIVAFDDAPVDGHARGVAAHGQRGNAALQVILLEDRLHGPRTGLALPLPEQHLVAIAQEGVGHTALLRVGLGLRRGVAWVDRVALGLDHGQRTAMAVAQHVVGARAVGQLHFEADGIAVERVPALRCEQRVDLHAGKGFVGHGMGQANPATALPIASARTTGLAGPAG
jgi:hypothetical protein